MRLYLLVLLILLACTAHARVSDVLRVVAPGEIITSPAVQAIHEHLRRCILPPRGLGPAKTYEVTFDNLGSKVKLSGLELMREGIPVRLEALTSSELLLFKAK